MSKTAFAEKLTAAGVAPHIVALRCCLAQFFNHGGSIEELREEVERAVFAVAKSTPHIVEKRNDKSSLLVVSPSTSVGVALRESQSPVKRAYVNQRQREKRKQDRVYAERHDIPTKGATWRDAVNAHRATEAQRSWRDLSRSINEMAEKSEFADRVVDILDQKIVDGRKFGDCEKHDFEHAIAALHSIEATTVLERKLYDGMAALLPEGVSVRQHNDRRAVLALCERYVTGTL